METNRTAFHPESDAQRAVESSNGLVELSFADLAQVGGGHIIMPTPDGGRTGRV